MSKGIVLSACCAVVAFAASAAVANAGQPSEKQMRQMGLSGSAVASDTVAMDVRGFGYSSRRHSKKKMDSKKPWAAASGKSYAYVELDGKHSSDEAGAGTHNSYAAEGKYFASGENYSEAGLTVSDTLSVDIGGVITSETKTRTINVFAGGYSSARAF